MSSKQLRLSYALAKQVPAMARGFTISTSYGDIEVSPDGHHNTFYVEAFQRLARLMLNQQLADAAAAEKVTGDE